MPNLTPQFSNSNVLLDSSKGINKFKLTDFVIASQVCGTNTIVENSDGTFSFKSQGGSTSGGTDVVYSLSKNRVWKGTLVFEVEFHNIGYSAQQCYGKWGSRVPYYAIKLGNNLRWLMFMSNNNLEKCGSIGLTAIGPACELKLLKAWQISTDIVA